MAIKPTSHVSMTLYEHLEDGQRAADGYPAAWDVGTEPAQLRMAPDSPLESTFRLNLVCQSL